METWDDQSFNSEWKNAFDGAEVTPSSKVWEHIDTQLLSRENASMKKRVIFYQRLAAASVGVVFLVSGYAFLGNNGSKNSIETNLSKAQINHTDSSNTEPLHNVLPDSDTKNSYNEVSQSANKLQKSSTSVAYNPQKPQNDDSETDGTLNQLNVAILYDNKSVTDLSISATLPMSEDLNIVLTPPTVSTLLPKKVKPNDLAIAYRVADARPAMITKKNKTGTDQNLWASLGFAAGNFTNTASNLDLVTASSNLAKSFDAPKTYTNSTKTEKTKPGSAFIMSLAGGKRLSKRWVLQGGLSYINQNLSSNTSTVEVVPAKDFMTTSAAFGPENTNSVTYTTESEINSTFQFISIPMQAGYLLLDRKFGIQLNGGLSPDVFLRSEVNDEGTGLESVTTTGSGSSFKAVSVSGIGGLELSYGFSKHYRISLTHGVRYALTPVYKESMLASAKPLMADIGLRFRYVFN